MTPPIIDHRDRLASTRRGVAGVLTAFAWLLYAWLWLPLITLLAWFAGLRTAYLRLYLEDQGVDTFVLLALPLIALGCALLMVGWAEYNRLRFAKRERRRRPADIDHGEVHAALGGTPALAERLRSDRVVTLSMDEDARPVTAIPGRG